jgi:glucose/arabinose dehydrogenase
MKQCLGVLAVLMMCMSPVFADEMATTPMATTPTETPAGTTMKHHGKDCVMMKDGKMMVKKGGKMMAMDADMTMPNGTVVMKDGTVKMSDGTTSTMKEGDRMGMDGMMIKPKMMKQKPAM